jgi:hypothetical protein
VIPRSRAQDGNDKLPKFSQALRSACFDGVAKVDQKIAGRGCGRLDGGLGEWHETPIAKSLLAPANASAGSGALPMHAALPYGDAKTIIHENSRAWISDCRANSGRQLWRKVEEREVRFEPFDSRGTFDADEHACDSFSPDVDP